MRYEYDAGSKTGSIVDKVKDVASKAKNLKNVLPKSEKTRTQKEVKSFSPAHTGSAATKVSYSSGFGSEKPVGKRILTGAFENKLMVAGILVILAVVVVVAGGITGYMTYTEKLGAELNQTQHELNSTLRDYNNCQNDLIGCASSREQAENALDNCESNLSFYTGKYESLSLSYDELNADYDECQNDKSTWQGQSDSWKTSHDSVVINYAKDICCNETDIAQQTQVFWSYSTSSHTVECADSGYWVNCSSGATNYP